MRVLVIEDDKITATIIQHALKEKGYTVDKAETGEQGIKLAKFHKGSYSSIVLDIMLPDVSGLDVCKEIRDNDDSTPILILSAKSEIEDKIKGLNTGADDYLTKPFDIKEFFARINALERRNRVLEGDIIKVRDLELNTTAHELKVDGDLVLLSHLQYRLLKYLVENRGKVVTRTEIKDNVWNMEGQQMFSNSLTVHIKELRKKIKDRKSNPMIITVRGSGYKFSTD